MMVLKKHQLNILNCHKTIKESKKAVIYITHKTSSKYILTYTYIYSDAHMPTRTHTHPHTHMHI